MDDDDLRARLDAQLAARRASGGRSRRRAAPRSERYQRWARILGPFRRLAIILATAVALTFVLRTFVVEPFYVPSGSMETTLHGCDGCNDDYVLVNKLSYHLHSVNRGDVVVFSRPAGVLTVDKALVKRVIATAGEAVELRSGAVYVNGAKLNEPYVNTSCAGGTRAESQPANVMVPRGEVFVMGDNRCDSSDSRTFGPIKTSTIVGRAFVIIWPLGRTRWL